MSEEKKSYHSMVFKLPGNPNVPPYTGKFVRKLASFFHKDQAEDVPEDLIGATIVDFGTMDDNKISSGGGLIIVYRPKGETAEKRIAFGFNDLAMWIEDDE